MVHLEGGAIKYNSDQYGNVHLLLEWRPNGLEYIPFTTIFLMYTFINSQPRISILL